MAVLVTGEADGKETTLLRFNCFDIEKSYIYGPERESKLFRMDPTVDGNPIGGPSNSYGPSCRKCCGKPAILVLRARWTLS